MAFAFPFSATAQVGTSDTVIGSWRLPGDGNHILNLEIQNLDSATPGGHLDSFTLELKDHTEGEFYPYLKDADWLSTTIPNLLFVSRSVGTEKQPHTLEDNVKTHVHVRLNGAKEFRLKAKSDTADTTIKVLGNVVRT